MPGPLSGPPANPAPVYGELAGAGRAGPSTRTHASTWRTTCGGSGMLFSVRFFYRALGTRTHGTRSSSRKSFTRN